MCLNFHSDVHGMQYKHGIDHSEKGIRRITQILNYERGFSFFSFHRASRPTPDTFTTLNRTPGISPLALPRRPKPEMRTSSFSSTKLRQPSLGTKAVTFFPFLMSCTRTHLRMAELGCFASTPTFSRTMPFACEDPPVGDVL